MSDQQQPPTWPPPPGPPPGPPAGPAPAGQGVPAAPPPAYAVPERAPRTLAVWVIVVAAALTVVQVASWATSWEASATLVDLAGSGTDVLAAPLFTYDFVNIALLPTMIAAYVVGCLWLQKARTNTELASRDWPHARSTAWVWLGWWVPIVSFWFPYQVVRDVRAATLRDGSSGLLGLWWTSWLLFNIGAQAASRMAPVQGVPDADLARALPWVETVATVGMLVALVIWVRVVREVTAVQRQWDAPA